MTPKSTTYAYYGSGNQISKVGDSVTTSEYDGFNQLVMVRDAAGTYYYGYNADGLRTAKCINGIATTHVWDGQDLVLELGGSEGYAASMKRGESPVGTPAFGIYLLEAVKCTKYIRGVNLIAAEDGTGARKYYMYNGHGDVVQLTNISGDVVKSYEYDAFGNEKNLDPSDANVFRYCGEYFDKETGTIYLRARYYNPAIGRFVTEDSVWGKVVDPLSLNLYTYCYNNPINTWDPSGHMTVYSTDGKRTEIINTPTQQAPYQSGVAAYQRTGDNSWNQWDVSKSASPGNLSGTVAGTMEFAAETGKSYIPEVIKNNIRPNNIGVGTWNNYITKEASSATSKFGTAAKVAKGAGYAAIGVDVGFGIYDNVQLYNEGKIDATKIGTDAAVDTTSGLVGLGLSTGTGALYGTVVPGAGNIAGAAVGFVAGVGYMAGTELWQPGGKSIKDRAKDGLYNWWTQDNTNWQMPSNSYTNNGYYRAPSALPQSR